MKLQDKVAVITGASSGIGKATAELFGREGANVVAVVGHNREAADRVVKSIRSAGGNAISVLCDVSDETKVKRMVHEALMAYKTIDILATSAGIIGPVKPVDKIEVADWDRVFHINVRGTFLCVKHCIPVMLKKGQGNIISLSSTAGLRGSPISPCYSATKGAIIAMTKAFALAYAKDGIRVNCILPGTIETPMADGMFQEGINGAKDNELRERFVGRHPLGRFGTAQEVAQGALYLASEASSFVTGINLIIDGGLST